MADEAESDGLRLLVVEDHDDITQMMVVMLDSLGHRAQGVSTVSGAVDALRSQHFDLILTDFSLPDGTGVDLLHRLGEQRPVGPGGRI